MSATHGASAGHIAALGVGIALLICLAVEIAIVGYKNDPPLQPFYLLLGAAISLVGLAWMASVAPSHLRRAIPLR